MLLTARLTVLEQRLNDPAKTPDNSSLPPSKGQKPNRSDASKTAGPRKGNLGRKGGGRSLMAEPDQVMSAKAAGCRQCGIVLGEADHHLHSRYDKIELRRVSPAVTRVERYARQCPCSGGTTLAPVPDGLEEGSPAGPNIVAMALYLRFTHAISYQGLCRLFRHLFGFFISEGALDALFRRAKPAFDDAITAILARLRRSWIVRSDKTSLRVDGRTCWNWVLQNAQVVIQVVRKSRGAGVVAEVMGGHRPTIWVSDLFGARQSHADLWQVCLAYQLRDSQFAIDAGDTVFAPRMKALLLRAVLLARQRHALAASTCQQYRKRLDRDLDDIIAFGPTARHGQRLRKRYGKVRNDLLTFLIHPEVPPDNNSSERELRPTATYHEGTGGFRSDWGAVLFASVRFLVGTAARNGIDAYAAIRDTLCGKQATALG